MAFSAPLRTRIESEPRRPATTVECALSEQVRAPGSSRIESAPVQTGCDLAYRRASAKSVPLDSPFDTHTDEHTGV